MSRGLIFSFLFHTLVIFITALTLPFMMREPIDVPPIVSVELIQIKDKTFIPYAPKARKIIEKVKEENKRVVSEQAPPSEKAKEKPDRIPLPDEKDQIKKLVKKKQNPEEIKPKIRQSSEFEKDELFDTNEIAALIDKAKEEQAETQKKNSELTQSSVKNSFAQSLSWIATFAVLYSTDDPHPTINIRDENKIKNNLLLKNIYPSIFIKNYSV